MKTVMISGKRECKVIEKPIPNIKEGFVLIKVHVAPMCNEYNAYENGFYQDRNKFDSLGHEIAGEVVKTAGESKFKVGDRVVALPGFPCGTCYICDSGAYAHCDDVINPLEACDSTSGECGFAEYAIKAEWLTIPIPNDMSYEHASMACCGLGSTFTSLQKMAVKANSTILITGLGAVGLGGVLNAKHLNLRVIGVSRSRYRRELARDLGCDHVLNPENDNLKSHIFQITNGLGVDYAIECSAQAHYQRLALDVIKKLGSLTFLGESGDLMINVDKDIIQKGLNLYGTLDLYLNHVPEMMKLIANASNDIDKFITHTFSLREIKQAWELQIKRTCGKILLYPNRK
ncbi:MAG: zinc-binding dehydrogenase [Spirochaetota bacterium]